jgi:adenylate cyclase
MLKRGFIIGCFVSLIVWSLYHFQIFKDIENRTYDLRQYLTLEEKIEDIIIVGIDDTSLAKLGRWPWDRDIHAQAIENILSAHPKVVGVDVLFTESSLDSAQDQALQKAINKKNVVLAGYVSMQNTSPDSTSPVYLKPIELFSNPNGHINVIPDKDGILRKAITDIRLTGNNIPSFDMQVLKKGNIPMPMSERVSNNGEFFVKYSNEPNTIPEISFWKIYNNQFDSKDIFGKVVLIGSTTVGIQDHYHTPVGGPMFGVEFHAQVLNSLVKGQELVPFPLSGTIIVMFGILSGIFFSYCGWLIGLIFVLLLTIAYLAFAIYQFDALLYIWPITYPFLGLYISYLFNVGFKIWEAQNEKNKTFRLFSRYVSYEVAKKLAHGGQVLDLGGVRREITVLFLDIRGFTSIAELKSPEEVVGILNSLFKIVNKVIFDHGGTLDKYIGDAVMAVFNAPLDIANHEEQAVQVAVEIQRRIAEHGKEYAKEYGADIGVGIGINSGEAVVGNIGTEERADYTAIGDVVNIAARLEAKAEKGEILIGKSTKEKLSTLSGVALKGSVNLDGKKELVEVYGIEWR